MSYALPLVIDDLRAPGRIELLSSVTRQKLPDGQMAFHEKLLQDLIHKEPGCLPIREIDSAFAGMKSICRELPVQCGDQDGYIDNLLVNASGRICLVECKLRANHEAGREVVAQVLSYAASLSRLHYNDLVAIIRKTKDAVGSDPLADLVLGSEASDDERHGFRDDIESNLRRGSFLLLVVGDRIRAGVEQIAALLQDNATLAFSFGLVEMPIYSMASGTNYFVQPRLLLRSEIITRTVFVAAEPGKEPTIRKVEAPGRPGSLSETEFYGELARHNPAYPDQVQNLLKKLHDLDCELRLLKKFNVYVDDGQGGRINVGSLGREGTLEIWGAAGRDRDRGVPLGLTYMQQVAQIFGGRVKDDLADPASWHVRVNDKIGIPLALVIERSDSWIGAITEFMSALRGLADQA